MKARYRLTTRGIRGSIFYCVDTQTGKRTSLQTKDSSAAREIVSAKNQALRNAHLNLQLARTYLAGSDSGVAARTWQNALDALVETKHGPTRERWVRAAKEKALDLIRHKVIIETQAEHLLDCHFGDEIADILRRLREGGPLFPHLRQVRSGDRATEFKQRCDGLGIAGVSLHSYRYAWAERALEAMMSSALKQRPPGFEGCSVSSVRRTPVARANRSAACY